MKLEIERALMALLPHKFCLNNRPELVNLYKLPDDIRLVAKLRDLERRAIIRRPDSAEARNFYEKAADVQLRVTNGIADRAPDWLLRLVVIR